MSPGSKALLGCALLAAGLRLFGLDAYDLWYDEAFAVYYSEHFRAVYESGISYTDLPFPMIALRGWRMLVGDSVWALRLFSALASIATVPLLYLLARRLERKPDASPVAAWTGFWAAIAPLMVYYAQEVRGYALMAFLATLATLISLDFKERRDQWRWQGLVWAGVLCCHVYGVFVVAAQCLGIAWVTRKSHRAWLRLAGASLLAVGGLLAVSWQGLANLLEGTANSRQWVPDAGFGKLLWAPMAWLFGYGAEFSVTPIFAFVWIGVLAVGWLRYPWRTERGQLVAAGLLGPYVVFALLVISPLRVAYLTRFFLASSGFVVILAGFALQPIGGKRLATAWPALALLLAGVLWPLANHYRNRMPHHIETSFGVVPRIEISEPLALIREQWQPGDIIIHSCRASLFPAKLYYAPELEQMPVAIDREFIDYEHSLHFRPDGEGIPEQFAEFLYQTPWREAIQGRKRVWAIYSVWVPGLQDAYLRNTDRVREAMNRWGNRTILETYPHTELGLYEAKTAPSNGG